MKNLIIILLLLAGTVSRAQDPKAAMAFADSLFHASSFDFAVVEFDFPADIRDILLRFNSAIAANREWFTAYSSRLSPGQPLPYDPKFGITQGEYERIKSMDKVHPALKVVDTQRVNVLRQGDRISFKGEGEGRILGYLEFDLGKNVLLFAGDTIPFAGGVHTNTAMAYGLFNSYTWRLQRTDLSGGLQADQLTARVIEIELGLHESDNKPLLRIQYQDMDHGVSRANLDLAGYIQ
ncbi:MAG TPA: hypothetical protein VHD83_16560 [Puia sp.]|nr:hypothetical protein [Puia sp.]